MSCHEATRPYPSLFTAIESHAAPKVQLVCAWRAPKVYRLVLRDNDASALDSISTRMGIPYASVVDSYCRPDTLLISVERRVRRLNPCCGSIVEYGSDAVSNWRVSKSGCLANKHGRNSELISYRRSLSACKENGPLIRNYLSVFIPDNFRLGMRAIFPFNVRLLY
jgi:hypothetical protein